MNVLPLYQQQLCKQEEDGLSIDSLGRRAQELDREEYYDEDGIQDDVSELTLGSVEEQEEEELTEEDRMKIERWTRIWEDGFEIINGVKYTSGGTIIYSDYDDEDEEEREEVQKEPDGTTSEIAAKTNGELLRTEARQRIEANPEAYEGLPRPDMDVLDTNRLNCEFDWDAESAEEKMNAVMLREQEIAEKEHDIYLANGGITNQELPYLMRRLKEKRII